MKQCPSCRGAPILPGEITCLACRLRPGLPFVSGGPSPDANPREHEHLDWSAEVPDMFGHHPSRCPSPVDLQMSPGVAASPWPPGGRYRILGELGRGGMGMNYRAFDRDLGREVAMKVIREPGASIESRPLECHSSAQVDRFLEEARILATLDHPNIVAVHDMGLDPHGQIYFTMQLVAGRGLHEIVPLIGVSGSGWDLDRALGVLLRASEAVAYAHARGIIHCDLKPHHILAGPEDRVTVIDWGLAIRTAASHGGADPEATSSLVPVARSIVSGTPAYMAPEQRAGHSSTIGPPADVFALGVILKELLSTALPPAWPETPGPSESPNLPSTHDAAPFPAQFSPQSFASLTQLCHHATSHSPALRPPHAEEFAMQLKRSIQP